MNAPQAITVTLNPAIDQLVTLDALLPGQVQRALGSMQAPGGKGINVAAALAGLGAPTAALGVLGSDNAGMFEALFAQRGIADACLRVPGQTRTNIKLVADGGRQTTDINLPGLALAEAHLHAVMSALARYRRPGLAVVLSGGLPAGLPADSWARLQAQAVAAGADVLLDTSEAPL
ncbi:1-phosphofructokinase family hexose kinase, partial [Delftia acidovorans]|uniref:1-phosphofructokinase family hexose kinase n=1 Tax=Delftia acidovorans TaxID=80866 RepID=UPI0035A083CD